jgi:integrase
MAIKSDPKNPNTFIVSYGKRHPITRQPVSLTRKGFTSKAEANRAYREMVVAVEDRIRKAILPKWSKVIAEYAEASLNRGLMQKTVYNYRVCLEAHTLGAWGERLVDTITTQEIRLLLDAKVGMKSPSHQRYFLKSIRAAFEFAVESGYILRNPTPQLKFKVGDKIQKVLNEDQARMLLARAKEQEWQWYPHYALALYTGMRNGELFALTWEKVDFDRRTILVDCAWNSKDGFKSTKSGDDRMIEIAPALLPILRELQIQADGSPYVLPQLYEWQKGEQAKHLATFLSAIGLPEVRFHDLRASWATMLLSKGVEPIKVMKMGGWKDLETMMIYARKAGVDIRGAMDCLNLHTGVDTGKVLHLSPAL